MAFVYDTALDAKLADIRTNAARLDICTLEPATYAAATTTNTLGNASVTIAAPADASPNGRKVTVAAIASASVTASGTATHWALTDGSSVLIATGALASSAAVTSGNTWSLAAFDITAPDAT